MAISTAVNEIDRKLDRIVHAANPTEFDSNAALARHIAESEPQEFSYRRFEQIEYASADTIATYVSYAKTIGLLDGDGRITEPKNDLRSLDSFRTWLGDSVLSYLTDNGCSLAELERAVRSCLHKAPTAVIPTQRNVHDKLKNPPEYVVYRLSLKILGILRPEAVMVRSRQMVIIPGVVTL